MVLYIFVDILLHLAGTQNYTPLLLILSILLGLVHGLFYALNWFDIFRFPIDKLEKYKFEPENLDITQENSRIINTMHKEVKNNLPKSYNFEHILHTFWGVFLGWIVLGYLINDLIKIEVKNITFTHFLIALLAWIGINGRLPTIAHMTQELTSALVGLVRKTNK